MQLLPRESGSMIVGIQTGSMEPGELVLKPPFVAERVEKTIYRHSKDTLARMWEQACAEQEICVKIDTTYDDQKIRKEFGEDKTDEEKRFFSGPEQVKIFFTIEIQWLAYGLTSVCQC